LVLQEILKYAIDSTPSKSLYIVKIKKGEKMAFRERGGFRGGFGGPREMHKATCADCGKECEVPFKPSGDRPVYCKECWQKHKKY